jgi:hypothetical protein
LAIEEHYHWGLLKNVKPTFYYKAIIARKLNKQLFEKMMKTKTLLKQEIRHVLIVAPLDEFAKAVDELGWERQPTSHQEGALAAWVPDDGGEVLWIEPAGAPAPILRLTGNNLDQLEEDLVFLARVTGTGMLIDLMAGASNRAELISILRLAGLLTRGSYDFALSELLAHALIAGDSEMQAAVAEGLRWTEWRELAAPIQQSLQMTTISPQVKERLISIYTRLKSL